MNRQPGSNMPVQFLNGTGRSIKVLLKGIILSLLVSMVFLFVAATVLYFTGVPEKAAPYFVFAISLLSILTGSYYAGKNIGSRGWVNGGTVGFIYVFLMLTLGLLILEDVTLGWNVISKLFLGFVFGAAGGMWGVNK